MRVDPVTIARATIAVAIAMWIATGAAPAARAAAEDAATAYEGVPSDGSFRVRGPVAFGRLASEGKRGSEDTVGVEASQAGAFDGVTKYTASCVREAPDRDAAKRIEETLAHWQKQAPFQYRKDVKVGKLAGVEFQIADRRKAMRVRVLAPPGRTCTLAVQWNHFAKPRAAEVEGFLGSFELVKR